MNKSTFLGMSILTLCGASYWFGATNGAISLPSTENLPSPTEDTQALTTELTRLKAENQSLQQQLASLHTKQINNKTFSTEETVSARAPSTKQHANIQAASLTAIDEQYKTLKRADAFASYAAELTAKGISLAKDMEEKFQTEQVDYDWAPEYQEKLGELFSMDNQLLAAEPEAIACKTHRCQIKIRVTDSEQANLLTAAFSSALETNKINIEKADVIAAPDFAQGYLNLYIAKNNKTTIYE